MEHLRKPVQIGMQFFAEDTEPQGDVDLFGEDSDPAQPALENQEPEPGNGTGEQPSEQQEKQPEGTPTGQEEPKYKLSVNGEEKELPLSEILKTAQRGMDYDVLRGESEGYKQQLEQLKPLEADGNMIRDMAASYGMDPAQFREMLKAQMQQVEISRLTGQGVPPEYAKQIMELRQKEAERSRREKEQSDKAEKTKQYSEFLKEYPEVKEFPTEVLQAMKTGETPLSAMRGYENKQLKAKIAALEKNQQNKQTTVGPVTSTAAKDGEDAFLAGFMAE